MKRVRDMNDGERMNHAARLAERKHAANHQAWAIGTQQRNGFKVWRIVWGLTMAKAEKRPHQEIRAATIMVGNRRRRR